MSIKTQPALSIIIHTKNEEAHIAECITSVLPVADEVVVIDMASTDQTVAIASQPKWQHKVRVIAVEDSGYVETVRQFGIDSAQSEWIFILDADERFTPSLRKAIRTHLQKSQPEPVVCVPRKNLLFGKWIKHGQYWPDYQIRFFRKGSLTWPAVIHTQPRWDTRQSLAWPSSPQYAILHLARKTIHEHIVTLIEQASHERHPFPSDHPSLKELEKYLHTEFLYHYHNLQGNKDGVRGWILAKLWEYYRFLAIAFYLEQKKFPELPTGTTTKTTITMAPNQAQRIIDLEDQLARIQHSKLYALYRWYEKGKQLLLRK